ncbi:MAG: response regulator receiver modulated diguanylate cyclase [Proteobacteria bacterium]|nr:response regulator receiver modulated diguanylate cyclase [Pseudomonadota bacterium]
MVNHTNLQKKFKTLRDAYTAQLPENIKQIRQAWGRLPLGEWDDVGFQILYLMVHNLAISGRTFGYYLLSDVARKLEGCLMPLTQAKTVLTEEQREHICDLMNELDQIPAVRRPLADAMSGAIIPLPTSETQVQRPTANY